MPVYRIVDNAGAAQDYVPYLYSSYEGETENRITDKKSVLVLVPAPSASGRA